MRIVDAFVKDLRQTLRMFRQSPGFALAAVAALTLGIGANTAIFSVVDAVLLKPVAVPQPDRLVVFMNTSAQGSGPAASPAKFAHWRHQTAVVDEVSAFNTGVVNYTGGTTPEQIPSGHASADFFALFGVPVAHGRTFTADEDLPHGPHVVVLSQEFWKRWLGSDPDIVGKTVSIGGDPYTVVGVLGNFSFSEFGEPPQLWLPFQLDPNSTDQGHYFMAAGRLRPGVTLRQAQTQVAASAVAFARRFPAAMGNGAGFSVQPIRDVLVSNVRPSLLVLLGAVTFVLLIACANVANLLLARATSRSREVAIRAAIGGTRGRIIRQLLTESVVLSLTGGVLGLVLGLIGIRALLSVNTAGLPRVGQAGALVGMDWRVLTFALAVSVGTGLLFGLIPALQSSRTDLTSVLKESSGRSGTGFRQNKARSVLVVTEVALALILLVGSALLIRTAMAIGNVDPGFDSSDVLTMRMSLAGPRFQTATAVSDLVRTTVDRLRTLPGVEAASATCCVPLEGGYGLPFVIVGRPLPPQTPFHGGGAWMTISPGYFQVFRIPVTRGRAFTDRDDRQAPPVVVINEAMARQFWPKGDPLADRLVIGRGVMKEFADEPDRQIIGVVGDTRDNGLNSEPGPRMYVPQAQLPDLANALNVSLTPMAWVVRTRVDPGSLSRAIQDQIRQTTGLPVSDVKTMDQIVSTSTSRQAFNMWVMSVFGGAALLLAAIGIYGLMAYLVEQRRQEIGIRLALGAQVRQVRRMVVVQGMALALAGVAVGVAASFGLAKLIASFLYGVSAWDPLVFTGVPVVLALVALVAVWVPARRASRVDPVVALRYE
jgi:putative ABC transport system permease protein